MADPYEIYQFPRHEQIEKGLLDFSAMLEERFAGSSLDVMKKGWCSPKNIWESGLICPELIEVENYFRDRLPKRDWDIVAWFNVLEQGGSIATHNHWQAEFACAYHIKGPSSLLFDFDGNIYLLPPTPGRLVIFSGLMMHSVPQPVSERRFSIAMNAHDCNGPLKKWRHERRS